MPRIEFFYDIISPYSYLAFEVLCRYRDAWTIELELRPFLLGGVHKATGNSAPVRVAAKALWMARDLARNADYFGVPLQIPKDFPAFTIKTQRLLTAVAREAPEHLEALSRRLWQRYWGEAEDAVGVEGLKAACEEVGVDAETAAHWLGRIADQDVKDALRATSDEAVARGAFGAPTFYVETPAGEEMYFGSDRFPHVAAALGVTWEGPLP
jgi:glutathione S-transferase kappa 1